MKIEKMVAARKNISDKFSSLFQSPEPGIHQIRVPLTNEVSCCTDALNLPEFLAVEPDTDSQDQTQRDEIDQLRNGCRASFVGSFPSQMPLRCRADKEMMKMVAGQEFQRVSQSIHRMPSVLMMKSLPHLTIPQMSIAKILFPEILEKFILSIYSPPFSIIRNMTNKGQGRIVFNNCISSLGQNMASY